MLPIMDVYVLFSIFTFKTFFCHLVHFPLHVVLRPLKTGKFLCLSKEFTVRSR